MWLNLLPRSVKKIRNKFKFNLFILLNITNRDVLGKSNRLLPFDSC
jgi:hypothetical protein